MKKTLRFRSNRQGFLLVTVVVMIAIASLMMSQLASKSMRVASAAVNEERDLRNRWAQTSLRRFSLNAADELFSSAQAHQAGEEPVQPVLWRNIGLSGQTWRIILSDESAKLSLPRARKHIQERELRGAMQSLIPPEADAEPTRNFTWAANQNVKRWEHWLRNDFRSIDAPRVIAAATQRMTLWGDGRLNVCRCDTQTLDTLWQQLFGHFPPEELQQIRQRVPPPTTNTLIGALALGESQATLVKEWLKTKSDCFSVWIFCESDRTVTRSFYVEWGRGNTAAQHRGYEY